MANTTEMEISTTREIGTWESVFMADKGLVLADILSLILSAIPVTPLREFFRLVRTYSDLFGSPKLDEKAAELEPAR